LFIYSVKQQKQTHAINDGKLFDACRIDYSCQ